MRKLCISHLDIEDIIISLFICLLLNFKHSGKLVLFFPNNPVSVLRNVIVILMIIACFTITQKHALTTRFSSGKQFYYKVTTIDWFATSTLGCPPQATWVCLNKQTSIHNLKQKGRLWQNASITRHHSTMTLKARVLTRGLRAVWSPGYNKERICQIIRVRSDTSIRLYWWLGWCDGLIDVIQAQSAEIITIVRLAISGTLGDTYFFRWDQGNSM